MKITARVSSDELEALVLDFVRKRGVPEDGKNAHVEWITTEGRIECEVVEMDPF